MDLTKSFTYLNKQNDKSMILKEVKAEFKVFQSKYLVLTKEVDRPDDFYYIDDDITFIIKLKNIGDKNICDFTLKDDIPTLINPTDSGFYEVITPIGDISFDDNCVVIEHINLSPGAEIEIIISGKVKDDNNLCSDEDIIF